MTNPSGEKKKLNKTLKIYQRKLFFKKERNVKENFCELFLKYNWTKCIPRQFIKFNYTNLKNTNYSTYIIYLFKFRINNIFWYGVNKMVKKKKN